MRLLSAFLPDEDSLKLETAQHPLGIYLAVYGLKIITKGRRQGEFLQLTKHFNTALLKNSPICTAIQIPRPCKFKLESF